MCSCAFALHHHADPFLKKGNKADNVVKREIHSLKCIVSNDTTFCQVFALGYSNENRAILVCGEESITGKLIHVDEDLLASIRLFR